MAPREKPKSPLALILGGAGVVVVALVAWLLRGGGSSETPAQAAEVPSIDLTQLADLAPLAETSESEWTQMNELVTRYITPPFGPGSVQAGDRLMARGKAAVPAILNGFKRLDLGTKDGAQIGWKMQTLLLQGLCKDTNFGWINETRPQDIAFNKQVIQRWFRAYEVAKSDDALWAEIAQAKDIPAGLAEKAKQ